MFSVKSELNGKLDEPRSSESSEIVKQQLQVKKLIYFSIKTN